MRSHVGAKVALAVSLALATAGCAEQETNFFPQDGQFTDPGCRAIATDRATDTWTLVADTDTQRQVFKLTYASCMDWRRTH